MNKNIIFMAGIHGVGKTTLCNIISNKYNIEHFSASQLISNYKNEQFTSLFIDGINENQDILVNITQHLFNNNKTYLLDGHFCLLNKYKIPEKIPQKTFENLNIKRILILTEDIQLIFNRLKLRNNYEYDLNMLSEFHSMELEYSKEIASVLKVPYEVLDISNTPSEELNYKLDSIFN